MKRRNLLPTILAVVGIMTIGAKAQNVWQGTGTSGWHDSIGNWSLNHFPEAGDAVVITNAGVSVVLSNSAPATGWLDSLTISNTASLIFTNWDTSLSATNIWALNESTITCAGPFSNAPAMSNRVWIICSNLTVEAGGGD